MIFETMPNTVPILERFLVLEDTVLRHLTLELPQKLRDYREKRALEEGKPVVPASELTEDMVEEPKMKEPAAPAEGASEEVKEPKEQVEKIEKVEAPGEETVKEDVEIPKDEGTIEGE